MQGQPIMLNAENGDDSNSGTSIDATMEKSE